MHNICCASYLAFECLQMSIPERSNWTGKIYLWDKIICDTPCRNIITLDFKNNWKLWSSEWYKVWWYYWFDTWQWRWWYSSSWMYWMAIQLPQSIFDWNDLYKVEIDVYRIYNVWIWLDLHAASLVSWTYPWCFRYNNWIGNNDVWFADWWLSWSQTLTNITWEYTMVLNIDSDKIYWKINTTEFNVLSNNAQLFKNARTNKTLWMHFWCWANSSSKSYIRKITFYTQ